MARFSEWSPYDQYVQAGTVDGQFMNASFTLLASGPPRLANIVGGQALFDGNNASNSAINEYVFPMGVVQNFSLSHNRQFNRIWEIGSERSFFISGRTVGQIGMSRILYHGPNLLRTLYAYYEDQVGATVVQSLFGGSNVFNTLTANPHDVIIPPGYDNMYLNLASDLFSQPIGLFSYFQNSNTESIGGTYFESAYVPNHTISTDSQGTLVQESAAMQFERAVPVAIASLDLIDIDGTVLQAAGIA